MRGADTCGHPPRGVVVSREGKAEVGAFAAIENILSRHLVDASAAKVEMCCERRDVTRKRKGPSGI